MVEGGRGAGDNFTIDWFALQGPQTGAELGATVFSSFTTGTQCNRVAFSKVRFLFLVSVGQQCHDLFYC